jgi:hypothetical protein
MVEESVAYSEAQTRPTNTLETSLIKPWSKNELEFVIGQSEITIRILGFFETWLLKLAHLAMVSEYLSSVS